MNMGRMVGMEKRRFPFPKIVFCESLTTGSKPPYPELLEDSDLVVGVEMFPLPRAHKWNSFLALLLPDKYHWVGLVPTFRRWRSGGWKS